MAQRTIVELVDDIDGGEAAETVKFALDGNEYEIDLSEKRAKSLRGALGNYIENARKIGGKRKSGGSRKSSGDAAVIRAWAKDNGWEVPERGRVSNEVREAYAAAH